MNAKFVLTLLALLAVVLGGAGPAAAQPFPSETFPIPACLIDAVGELRAADLARLPANAREAIITGENLDDTIAEITCTRSATRETAELFCKAFLPGVLARNFTVTSFLSPGLIDFKPCTGVREIVPADSGSLKAGTETSSVCQTHFPGGGSCFSLELRLLARTRG